MEPIDTQHLAEWMQQASSSRSTRVVSNAMQLCSAGSMALNRSLLGTMRHDDYSHTLDHWPVSNQRKSGRCWMFAGLNLLRSLACDKLHLKDITFSANYLFFYDKLERANTFLHDVISTRQRSVNGDRLTSYLYAHCISDGGHWNMFADLVTKYGVVPADSMPECVSSNGSAQMNARLKELLLQTALAMRQQGLSLDQMHAIRRTALQVVYRMLVMHLGMPPTTVDWSFTPNHKVPSKGNKKFTRLSNLTPQQFFARVVGADMASYVCLVHDPREQTVVDAVYGLGWLRNILGTDPMRFISTDIDTIKRASRDTIVIDKQPVWFGCCFSKQIYKEKGLMHAQLFDYAQLYDHPYTLTKAQRLDVADTRVTHAMLFTGLDVRDKHKDTPRKWRVENSHGEKSGKKGFLLLDNSWFEEYVYEVIVPLHRLPQRLQDIWRSSDVPQEYLPPWDPMGTLADCACDRDHTAGQDENLVVDDVHSLSGRLTARL